MNSYDCSNLIKAYDYKWTPIIKSKVGHLDKTEKLSLIMG